MKFLKPKTAGRLGAALGLTTLVVLATTTAAFAATVSQASANAVNVEVGGTSLATTGTYTSSNDGTTQTNTGPSAPSVAILNSETSLAVGALAQNAVANPDGTSSACAGAVGAGGLIQIGGTTPCSFTGSPGGINLGDQIEVDAALAKCSDTAAGPPAGSTTILNLTLGGNQVPGSSAQPAPNTVLLAGIVTLNKQTTNPDGSLTVTAVDLTIPPGMPNSGLHVAIGTVTCGPNGPLAVTPTFPVKGLPIAAGVAGLGLGAAYLRRRHNVARAAARA